MPTPPASGHAPAFAPRAAPVAGGPSLHAGTAACVAELPKRWTRFPARLTRSLGFGVLVAGVLTVLLRQDFWITLVYSLCISALCWTFIDLGGAFVAHQIGNRERARLADPTLRDLHWPGSAWMSAIVIFGTVLGAGLGTALGNLLTGGGVEMSELFSMRNVTTTLLISLMPSAVVTYMFYSRELLASHQRKAEAAERLAAENRLRLLESQLEPHMLFNTLANLRVLIGLDPARAQTMLDHLIAFMRSTLGASRVGQHTLEAEFARLADYLALIEIRMGPRLHTRFELPPALAGLAVPALLLQPLVENSVKHGLEPHVDGGRIEVKARADAGHLILSVRDTGAGLSVVPSDGSHFGLQQVQERITTLFGHDASFALTAAADDEGGTLAEIRLPLVRLQAPT